MAVQVIPLLRHPLQIQTQPKEMMEELELKPELLMEVVVEE